MTKHKKHKKTTNDDKCLHDELYEQLNKLENFKKYGGAGYCTACRSSIYYLGSYLFKYFQEMEDYDKA